MDELEEQPKNKNLVLIIALAIPIIMGLAAGGYYLYKYKFKTASDSSGANSAAETASELWPESDSPWPMFHGNYNHTGYADVSGPKTSQLKWKYLVGVDVGGWPNSVVVSREGTVFVAGSGKITALSADGSLKWAKDYLSPQGPALSADGTTLYFTSQTSLVAASPLDGAKKWEFKAGNNMVFGPTIGPDGTIYQGSWDKYFYAINPDGTLKWKYLTKGTISYPSSIDENGNIYLGGGDAHFGPDGNIYAFDSLGNLLWTYDTKMLRVGSPAVGYDGLLYFPASPALFVLDASGKLIWKKGPDATVTQNATPNEAPSGASANATPSQASSAASSAACPPPPAPCGNATGGGTQGGAQGGPSSMTVAAGMEVIAGIITPALTPDGLIFIGNPQGKFMAIDAKTQTIKWSFQTGKNPDPKGIEYGLPSFVIADKDRTSYFGAFDHKFYAVDKDGKEKWSFETGDKITEASPAIGADGTIYFTSEDGYVYAIEG